MALLTPAAPHLTEKQTGLLNTAEAAASLGISKRSLQERVQDRELAFVKIGRSIRFDPSDLAAFIDRNRVKARGWKGGA